MTAAELRLTNINTFIKDLHVSWLRRIIIQSDNASWCSVLNVDFGILLRFGSGYIKTALTNTVNPFWKDILNDWISFCNSIDIEKTQDILDSPLWYNKTLINGKNSVFVSGKERELGMCPTFLTSKETYMIMRPLKPVSI